MNNPTFYKNYFFIKIPEVCNYDKKSLKCFQESFWSEIDLLISHRIGKNNRFSPLLATDNVTAKLSKNAKIVWIPVVYFDGYFPQHVQPSKYLEDYKNVDKAIARRDGRFNGDKYIDKLFAESLGEESIKISKLVEYIKRQDFISEEDVLSGVEKSFEELRRREKVCDIHMSDIVVENYKRRQIFYSPNHPIQEILLEETKRILKFIGISDMTFNNLKTLLDVKSSLIGQDIPIYPKVKKILGLQNFLTEYYPNKYLWNFRGDYIEYLTEYAKWYWKDKLILD